MCIISLNCYHLQETPGRVKEIIPEERNFIETLFISDYSQKWKPGDKFRLWETTSLLIVMTQLVIYSPKYGTICQDTIDKPWFLTIFRLWTPNCSIRSKICRFLGRDVFKSCEKVFPHSSIPWIVEKCWKKGSWSVSLKF